MDRATLHRWTHADLARLPEDGKRYEIIDGELCMTPSPSMRHQRAVLRLAEMLSAFAREHGLGEVYVAPADVRISDHDVVEPDVFFVAAENLAIIGDAFVEGAPDLVIEVASDSTRGRDCTIKKGLYETAGVREYWLVDPEAERVTVHGREPTGFAVGVEHASGAVVTTPLLPGLRIAVADVFSRWSCGRSSPP